MVTPVVTREHICFVHCCEALLAPFYLCISLKESLSLWFNSIEASLRHLEIAAVAERPGAWWPCRRPSSWAPALSTHIPVENTNQRVYLYHPGHPLPGGCSRWFKLPNGSSFLTVRAGQDIWPTLLQPTAGLWRPDKRWWSRCIGWMGMVKLPVQPNCALVLMKLWARASHS